MIDRNDRNFLIWDPDGGALSVAPRQDDLNLEEIDEIFNRQIGFTVDSGTVFLNEPVAVACEASGSTITIFLLTRGEPPYSLSRNGTEIATGLEPDDFPFTDNPGGTGEFCYVITDSAQDTDETCCTI